VCVFCLLARQSSKLGGHFASLSFLEGEGSRRVFGVFFVLVPTLTSAAKMPSPYEF